MEKTSKLAEESFYADLAQAIRATRVALRKRQPEVAGAIGVTYQQLQKYERGTSRIPVDRLVRLAAYLEIPLQQLIPMHRNRNSTWRLSMEQIRAEGFQTLLAYWADIQHPPTRAFVLNLIKTAAEAQTE